MADVQRDGCEEEGRAGGLEVRDALLDLTKVGI